MRAGLDAAEAARARPGFSVADRTQQRVVQDLTVLPEECSAELRQTAERLLRTMPDANELDLWVVLVAMQQRNQPEAVDLAVRAIEHPATGLKEWYSALLDWLGREDLVVPTLVGALEAGLRPSPRPDASLLIAALQSRAAAEALETVRPYLAHSDSSARDAALGFLWDFDDSGATDLLLRQLDRETDPELAAAIIDTLMGLDCRDAVPALRAFARNPARAQNLRDAAAAAAEELAARESS